MVFRQVLCSYTGYTYIPHSVSGSVRACV